MKVAPCIDDCGRIVAHMPTRTGRCKACAYRRMVVTVRPDTLRCYSCRKWKPDEEYPSDTRQLARRGRDGRCRACNTKNRQTYRERHKVPCVACGAPRLPANEKGAGRGWADTGLCRECWLASLRKADTDTILELRGQGLTHRQIADRVGLNPSSVTRRLERHAPWLVAAHSGGPTP